MIAPADVTILVVMAGETAYWRYTRPFIADYCKRHGYAFRIFAEHCSQPHHPSWTKLVAASFVVTPHVLIWDADLVPLPWAPPIHAELSSDLLGMVKITPSSSGRMKLRRRYGRNAEPNMHFNCGLVSVPHRWKETLRNVFFATDRNRSIFWEQGALNHHIFTKKIAVNELDSRWNCWVSSTLQKSHIDTQHCLHFAKGSSRRMRNIGRLCKMLRLAGKLPQWATF